MRGQYPILFGLGLVAWCTLLFLIIEAGRAVSLW